MIRHSDRGTKFTFYDQQKVVNGHQITSSMSKVRPCGDNAPAEGLFGMPKRERINRRRYLTVSDVRVEVFDYIERFRNPRIQRRLDSRDRRGKTLSRPPAKTG